MNFRTRDLRIATLLLLVPCALLACSSGGATTAEQRTSLHELYQLMLVSPGLDSDGDDVPDDVELHPLLFTDPHRADTDGDGLLDNFEIFGPSFLFIATGGQAGVLDLAGELPDTNENGIHAALDPDERNEQFMIDSDNDGVVNYLEYYGYTYNWSTGEFVKWTYEDRMAYPEVPWFKTDPLQPSTDQDAYSDGLEVSRAMMDAAVRPPGDHPLVPAYPNIVVRLEGYAITLNEEITYSKGGSLAKGQTWNRETTRTHSYSEHYDWETGVEAGYTNGGGHIVAHFNFAWGNETTNTTSTSIAVGGSVNEEVNWDRARSYNPTDAAHIKLFLKVENCGTAPASNVIPTLNLRVGGSNVATFEQANFKIHMLMPGESYPEGNDIYWVVDAIDTGVGMVPLALTDFELKAIESGAPVNLAVTQVQADVMLLEEDGTWQRAGDINEYLSRCQAVSANVYADVGDGKFLHHLVYADDEPTGPAVTLSDALKWSMGGYEKNGQVFIQYRAPNGMTEDIALTEEGKEGWTVHVDAATFEKRPQGEAPWDMLLGPDSHVELMAPRATASDPPAIYDAYAVPLEEGYEVVCCASDYDGINEVVFIDHAGVETPMEPDGRGPWFFSCQVPAEYEFEGGEQVRVTSINVVAAAAYQEIAPIHTVVTEPPLISRLIYDSQNRRLEAKVEAGGSLAEDAVTWVRLYHPGFLAAHTGEDRDGYITMEETVYWFEDPFIYECLLPSGWISGMRVVAQSAGGQYTAVEAKDVATLKPYGSGQVILQAEIDWTATDAWQVPQVDLDVLPTGTIPLKGDHSWWTPPWGNFHGGGDHFDDGWPGDGIDYLRANGPPADIFVRSWGDDDNPSWFGLGCQDSGMKPDAGDMGSKSPDVYYLELTEKEVLALSTRFVDGSTERVGTGSVFAFLTTDGRYGKLIVRQAYYWEDDDCFIWCWDNWDKMKVTCDYVLFRKSGDGTAPPSMTYTEPVAYYSVDHAITANEPVFTGEGDPVDTFTVSPSLPAGLALDPNTGFITGTPTATQGLVTYTVKGENTAGSTTATIDIAVLSSPSNLSYPTSPITCDTGETMPPQTPTVSGDVDSYSISPTLPTGLDLDETTGVISGTPVQVTSETSYTVTASNSAGASTTTVVKIATPLGAPRNLSYTLMSAYYEVNKGIIPNTPTVTNPVDEWSISPALPSGLVFDTQTGYISGTPTLTSAATDYTIVATNAAGYTTAVITIEVYAPSP